MIIPVDGEQALNNLQHHVKATHDKPTASIKLSDKMLK
jgi:hypothetical protein